MAKKENGKGFIKLYRSILACDLWRTDEPFDKRSAWIDLLLLTQHSDYKGVKRGECAASQHWLAKRWNWSRKKVNHFLHHLEVLGMVTTKCTTKGTTLIIVNYEKFQGGVATKDTTKGTGEGTTKGTTSGTQTINVYTSNGYTMNDSTSVDPASLWDPQGRVYE